MVVTNLSKIFLSDNAGGNGIMAMIYSEKMRKLTIIGMISEY